jgi:hypothetical protein
MQQIIAAACSIDHAKQVRALYEQRGLKARELYSEMDEDKQERVMQELEQLQIDCIVQVQMLGEGFDHPPLSVAAVFRPFRSLSPYVQFVGRIMRVMIQDDAQNPANHGYVISHIGLNNDANWRDFREFDLEDQQVFREWLESQNEGELSEGGEGHGRPRRFDEDMIVHSEIISEFVKQSFLDPSDDRIIDKILDAVVPGIGIPFRDFMSPEQARAMLKKAQAKMMEGAPEVLPVSPQKRRQGARKRIADRPKAIAARIIRDLGLSPKGYEVSRLMPGARGTNNLVSVIRLLQTEIDQRLNIAGRQRNSPSASELEEAMKDLDALGDIVRDRIKNEQGRNHG